MPRLTVTAYRLRLLPLALALIVVTTAMPVDLRALTGWDGTLEPLDLVFNLLLYAPLGLALRRRPWRQVLLAAALLSTVIELAQMWNCERHPSPGDVVANTAGALLAMGLGRRLWRDGAAAPAGIPVGRFLVVAAICAVGALLAAGNLPVRSTAITGWDPGYPLLLGNEMTGDRPWRGSIENLALIPGSLRSGERRALADRGAAGNAAVLARAAFDTSVAVFLDGGAALRLPVEAARHLAQAAQAENGLTIVARIVPATVDQKGPARIVSFSTDPQHRNFDLGQEGRTLVFRIRTPFSGGNGTRRPVVSAPVLEAGRPVTVVGSYDGRVARLYIDGRLSGRENLAAEASAGSTLADEVLPAVCAVMGALLALIARSVVVGRGRRSTVVAALAAGAVTLALPVLAPGIAAALAAVPWSGVGGLIGVAAVLAAAE